MTYGNGPVRIGHGPWHYCLGQWPPRWWKWLFYRPRPDLIISKTRVPEWDLLHSEWRFFQALFCYIGPPSHILYNIKWPFFGVLLVTMVMTFYSYGVNQWDWEAMSLMLTFRLQRCYERWNLARGSLAGVGNGTTTIMMLAATWIKDPDVVDDFRRFCIVWPFSILQVCMNSKTLDPRAAKLLHPAEMKVYQGSRKGRQVVVTKVRQLAADAGLNTEQFIAMENAVAMTWKSAGDALRIRFQAMPHSVTLLCTGFVQIWCLMIPIGMASEDGNNYTLTFLASVLIAIMLLGIDEVATQMEEPFKLMPLDDIVVTYDRDINRIVDELRMLREVEVITRAEKKAARLIPQPSKSESARSNHLFPSLSQQGHSHDPGLFSESPFCHETSPKIVSRVYSRAPVDGLEYPLQMEYPLSVQGLLSEADRVHTSTSDAHPLAERGSHDVLHADVTFRPPDIHEVPSPLSSVDFRTSQAGSQADSPRLNLSSPSHLRGHSIMAQSKLAGPGVHPHSRQSLLLEEEEKGERPSDSSAYSSYTPPVM